ncbi:chromatin remodeling 24 [Quillaja saponaria]|uniref:Chromatin remodeling 24 n=1 Tax=Quillaja saponaria TaxID=32244 RepID=A0AAD7PAA8_QUISA|nr:chromatin remodeling 24 [Quillaja saponaria]
MAEKSSKRSMSLNDSHYRVLQDLSAPPKPSAIPSDNEEEKPSKIKLEGRRHLLKAPSMKDGSNDDGNIPQFSAITDFVSSPVEEEENPVKIEGRRRLCKVSSRDSTIEQDDNIPQFSAITDFDSSSVVEEEKPVKIEGRRRLCKVSSRDSTTEHDDKIPQFSGLTDFDSQPKKAKETKVRVEGRRRLCKVSSRNNPKNGLELDESTFSNLKDFDSPPPPSKNIIERDNNGGRNEIFDILNDLTSRFEFLSVERKRVPKEIQQVEDSSSLIGEKEISKEKIVELPDYESADSSFSPTSSQSDISPDATKSGGVGFKTVDDYEKETLEVENAVDQLNDVEEYSGEDMETGAAFVSEVKKEGRLEYGRIGLNEASKNREPQTHKMNKISSVFNVEDDDNDDCVIVSGRKMESKVQRQVTEFIEEEDDSVEVLDDFVSEDEDSITLSGPRSTYKLLGKIAKMLYPHQRDGLRWLWSLHCQGKGGILGDDMGLGKTMQISGFLAGLFDSHLIRRVLIVAPKTLLPHWVKELSIVGLSDRIREYFGTSTKAREYELQYILQDKGVLLTTYDIVRNNSKSLRGDYYHGDGGNEEGALWDYMILDEGHLIKNPSTQRAKSLLEISSAHRIVISGTPLQNNLKVVCMKIVLVYWFKDKFETPILRGNDKSASDREKHTGSTVAKELRDRIQPYFLRRLKSEVFNQDNDKTNAKLSKKNEMIVWLRLTRCQRQLYEAFLKSELVLSAFDGSPLAALTILKKICDHPLLLTKRAAEDVLEGMDSVLNPEDVHVAEKLAMHIADVADTDVFEEKHDVSCKISFVMSLLDNLIPEGHNVLIFSQTRKMLNLIEESLVSKGYGFLRIDGTTKACDRLKIVNDFQDGIGAPIFLLTSQVGGLGLTLTKADRVIVVDPAWNPRVNRRSIWRFTFSIVPTPTLPEGINGSDL